MCQLLYISKYSLAIIYHEPSPSFAETFILFVRLANLTEPPSKSFIASAKACSSHGGTITLYMDKQ